ncbi:hypothetical protein LOK49_LG02G01879 [Camellia lanceoleosa]|uniref:Uncharacterized protein n=1 Tax=Camellia lanceoleosa TaxID=1840588 RepID=A0ACC0IIC1_9ERIC|nr:hypothetical protein LOK49_LG02G01879 [Camellia lanceoleosa]
MKDIVAKAVIAKNRVPLSISEHEAIVSQIKTKAAQAHNEMVESKGMLPKDVSDLRKDTEKKQKTWHFWRSGIVRSAEASATAVPAGRSKDTNPLEKTATWHPLILLAVSSPPMITPKVGKDSWLNSLQNCTSRSPYILKKLTLERKIRSWIEDQNSKFAEKVKEAKERVVAAKHKEKQLKQKMKDKVTKAVSKKWCSSFNF